MSVSSVAIPLRLHRYFFHFLASLSAPPVVEGSLTGLTNLCWYELAYVLGGAGKIVGLFEILPLLGSASGILSVIALFTTVRWLRPFRMFHLLFGTAVGVASLLVLLDRLRRGYDDPWRLVATTSFVLMNALWFAYYRRSRRRCISAQPAVNTRQDDSPPRA
jgi:hypothetical protein